MTVSDRDGLAEDIFSKYQAMMGIEGHANLQQVIRSNPQHIGGIEGGRDATDVLLQGSFGMSSANQNLPDDFHLL